MQKLAHISVIPLGYSERFCSVTLNSVLQSFCFTTTAMSFNCQGDNISDRAVNWGCCWRAVYHSWGGGGQALLISWFVWKCYNFIHGKPISVNASQACEVLEVTKGCVKVFLPHCLILDAIHQRAIGEKAKHLHPCVQLLKFTLDCG